MDLPETKGPSLETGETMPLLPSLMDWLPENIWRSSE